MTTVAVVTIITTKKGNNFRGRGRGRGRYFNNSNRGGYNNNRGNYSVHVAENSSGPSESGPKQNQTFTVERTNKN